MIQESTKNQALLLWLIRKKVYRPSSKPICDQQFLGEAQSSTAAY
ncbi:hypothetical protein [Cardinium endosymbiont of Dermatophagoides farinae]|nr:hypothetical protein [Cardinium endosymbiont of Dermatophagoides farinae]